MTLGYNDKTYPVLFSSTVLVSITIQRCALDNMRGFYFIPIILVCWIIHPIGRWSEN